MVMRIVSSLFDENYLTTLKELNVTHILINELEFSSGVKGFGLKELKDVTNKAHSLNLKVIVKADRLYGQDELEELTCFLKYLDEIKVDEILFSDLTIKILVDKYHLNLQTIYAPETLLTNQYDVKELQLDGFTSCVISKDIPLSEMFDIALYNKDYCYLRVHGPILISYGLRRFLSVYLDEFKEYKDNYYLCEENRDTLLPIVEKESGTWLYGSTLQSLMEIEDIVKQPLRGIIFDNNLYDDKYTVEVIKLYQEVLTQKIDCQKALEKLENLNNKIIYTGISEIKKTALEKD